MGDKEREAGPPAKPQDIDAKRMGFEGLAGAVATGHEAGVISTVAREEAELKAMIIVALRFPRDEAAAATKLLKACKRPGFAAGGLYSFPRGGHTIGGPSVKLARESARTWRNVRSGLRIVSIDEETVHLKGFAHDLESNTTREIEDKFARLIQRKQKGGKTKWVRPDERDLRELIFRRGAICERNAILTIIPPDLIDEAMRVCVDTNIKAAKGEIEQDRSAAVRSVAVAFDQMGVTTAMLEKYLDHSLDLIDEKELVHLRDVFKAIKDGVKGRSDYFVIPKGTEAEKGKVSLADVRAKEDEPRLAKLRAEQIAQSKKDASERKAAQAKDPKEEADELRAEIAKLKAAQKPAVSEPTAPAAEPTPTDEEEEGEQQGIF